MDAPCNIVRHLKPREPQINAVELHFGWVACRNREPFDASQPPAWQVGYRMYQEDQLDMGIRALRQALWEGVTPNEAPMPRVYPAP